MSSRTRWIAAVAVLACWLSTQTSSNPAQHRPWYKIDEARRHVETPQKIWQSIIS